MRATKDDRERPAFDHLLADLHRGHAFTAGPLMGVVAVADDRLYRRPDDFIRFMAALTAQPGRVYVGRDGLRDPYTKAGLLEGAASLQGAVAEGKMRSRRVQDWHWSRAMDGLPHSGPRPFGWLEDRQTLHPVESELVRKAIEHRIAGGSMGEVVREWAALGVTGTRGGRPNPQALTQIITSPRVCGFRANRGELLIDPETEQPLVGAWQAIVTPDQWRAVCATFSAGSLYMHRGPLSPRLTDGTVGPKYLASGFLRCGAPLSEGSECGQLMGGSKNARSRRSPYSYICIAGRGCGRCAISGPLVDDAIERLLMPGDESGLVRLPKPMRMRWQSGEMGLEEKRRVVASVFVHLSIRPGRKGCQTWDYTRVVPVWKWADRIKPMDPAA
ncbi:recombinase family protein [Streptomyces katrae]|uniref:Recombinase family protein n=1 Tax=Streptomyces katrae TaxID=68223 RepID=A0ABT7GUV1_9ACTN|nr:recombinase family protein [Streptomyces katrae]MDK9497408.1 recombinase family protein [Streptomyces katrae]